MKATPIGVEQRPMARSLMVAAGATSGFVPVLLPC